MEDAEIKRILGTKDFYQILGVARNVEENDLRRQYKRLALTCHPDKCNHPQAEDAFKAVGKAFSTLSDAQKRAQYDRFGEEGLQRTQPSGRRGEVHPDDLYDLFTQMFGGDIQGMQGRRFTGARGQPQPARPMHPAQAMPLFQLLPVLVLFMVYLLFNVGSNERTAPYSLHLEQENGYSVKRRTKDHHIPYFVQPSFARDYARDVAYLRHIEDHVLETYKAHLSRRCKFEQREKSTTRQRASLSSGKDRQAMLTQADQQPTPACDELQKLISTFGY